jgi:hypothetical protein
MKASAGLFFCVALVASVTATSSTGSERRAKRASGLAPVYSSCSQNGSVALTVSPSIAVQAGLYSLFIRSSMTARARVALFSVSYLAHGSDF